MVDILLDLLSVGDMRTTGNVERVVTEVLAAPELMDPLVEAVQHTNPAVCMRAADALEKISQVNRQIVEGYKERLLSILEVSDQQEVQWHLAQILPRLALTRHEALGTYGVLMRNFHKSGSSIVRTWSLQAMADLTNKLPEKGNEVRQLAAEATRSGTPAMKSRARKILKQLG